MSDLSPSAERPLVVLFRRLFIGAPSEEVWEWLWDPERVEQYALAPLEQRPSAPGDSVRYLGRLSRLLVGGGEVEEIVKGRRLVHSFTLELPEPDPPSRVMYELIRYGDAMCCLEVRHEGLCAATETFNTLSHSWDVTLSSLKTCVETGRPLPWPARGR